jgi:hypothetical protein
MKKILFIAYLAFTVLTPFMVFAEGNVPQVSEPVGTGNPPPTK